MAMIVYLILLLLLVLILKVINSIVRYKDDYWKNKEVAFIKPLPLIGNILNILLMRENMGDFYRSVYERTMEPYIGLYVFDYPCLLVKDLSLIKRILIKDFDHFADRPVAEAHNNEDLTRNFLFFMKNPRWKALRNKVAKGFSTGKMKTFSVITNKNAEEMIDYIETKGETLEVMDISAKYVVDGLMSTYFGLEGGCFKDEHSVFHDLARSMFDETTAINHFKALLFFLSPKFVKIFKLTFMSIPVSRCLRQIFAQASAKRKKENGSEKNDLLDVMLTLINNRCKIDGIYHFDEEVGAAQLGSIFIAAYETSTFSITYCLYELASKPEIQIKMRQEILDCNNQYGFFSYESIHAMKYLKAVILETLRIYPILPFIDRECIREYRIPGTDVTLSPGDRVCFSLWGQQMDEKYFPDPEIFNPDRFYGKKSNVEKNLAFLAFGEGPRGCIGRRPGMLTVSYALAHILSKFKFEFAKGSGQKIQFHERDFLLKPKDAIYLKFVPWEV